MLLLIDWTSHPVRRLQHGGNTSLSAGYQLVGNSCVYLGMFDTPVVGKTFFYIYEEFICKQITRFLCSKIMFFYYVIIIVLC